MIENSNKQPFSPANKVENLEKTIKVAESLVENPETTEETLTEAQAELEEQINHINDLPRPETPIYYPNTDKSSAVETLPATGENKLYQLTSLIALFLIILTVLVLKFEFS